MTKSLPNKTRAIWIAPCGLNCRLCMAFIRDKNTCPGCRGDDSSKSRSCAACVIKNCKKIKAGEIKYCFDCGDFPCPRLSHLDQRYKTKYRTSALDNLRTIKDFGIRNFVENENKKWACPQCGSLLCMHKPQCLSCGYVWNT